MNKIEKLIKEKCPNGVEYKTIKSIAKVLRGKRLTTKELNNSEKYPVFHGGLEPLGYYHESNRAGDTVMIINVGASAGTVGYSEKEFWSSDGCYCIDHCELLLNRYLYHYLKNNEKQFINKVRKAGIPTLDGKVIENFKIPLPPLEVQEEIVRILDQFIKLEAELEAELKARKSQYEFWRGKLLNNSNYVNKKLGDLATFSQGIQVDPKEQYSVCEEGMVPFLRIVDFVKNDEPPRYIKKPDDKYIKQEDSEMVMIRYGASAAGKVFINKFGAIANNMFKVNFIDKNINIKYIWHYLSQEKVYKELNNTGGGSTMPAINFKLAASIDIFLPPLDEQARIVSLLDKFDALVNDITVGLPAEIELRRKQYEYYRNKLLSFEEVSCE